MADEFREFITSQNSNNLLVARAVASSVKTLLGPQHSLKCVLSEEDAVMCSSTSKLLQFIDIQHPAGFIINDVCQGQFKKFRTNCKTLVCMTGFWSKAAQDLQYQGIPVPVIVQLFEEALSMCEEILQELSLPVITALQNHTAAEHFEAEIIADKGAFTVCESHVLKDESKEFRSSDYDDCNASGNDGDGDGDISWYFASPDGHIPGVHDQMPGTNHQIPGVYELSGISPTAKPAAIIDQSFSSVALLDESWQQERKGYEETEDRTLTVGKTREMTINTRVHKTEKFKQNEKDEKDCRQFALSSLRSKLVDDEDEFEASFLDASVRFNQDVAQPSNQEFLYTKLPMGEKEGICNTLTKDRLLSSVFVQERDNNRKNVKNKTSSCFETEPSKTCLGSKTINSKSVSFSKEDNGLAADSLLSFLSGRVKAKNKETGNQVRLSEICKGSRHLVKASPKEITSNGSLSSPTPFWIHEHTADIIPRNEDCRRTGLNRAHLLDPSFGASVSNVHGSKATCQTESKNSLGIMLDTDGRNRSSRKTGLPSLFNTKSGRLPDLTSTSRFETTSSTAVTDTCSIVFQARDRTKLTDINLLLLSKLGELLSHGKEQEMNLAIEVVKHLFRSSGKTSLGDFTIHLNMIHTELILRPSGSFSRVINGLLLENKAEFQIIAARSSVGEGADLRSIALINGDITESFRHIGLGEELQINKIIHGETNFKQSVVNEEKDWCHRVTGILTVLDVGILVAKGTVQVSILDYCLSHNIVVLQNVVYSKLLLLSFATKASLVTYITDLRAQDVGRPVTIETYELGWMPVIVGRKKDPLVDDGVQMCQYILVRNDTTNDTCPDDFISPLQTVLLCGPTEQHESAKVSRPLSGWLEGGMEHLRPLVYAAFAEGFKEFLASVITNSGHFTSLHGVSTHVEYLIKEGLSLNSHGSIGTKTFESTHNQPGVLADVTREHTDLSSRETTQNFPENLNHNVTFEDKSREVETLVWDNYTAKKEAWKRAVGIVRVLLQTDMLVQTGLNAAENEAELL
ncbi:uncharacterized protein [Acropora muricata]|uniref:uncharacterized protein isoform X3 n=1 Tax=Acropora muricata TaxID=159855 RepID=UPI0034E559AC